jgi:hypothetical protein
MTKTCSKCGETKGTGEFYLKRGKPESPCKACRKSSVRCYRRANPDRVREVARERYWSDIERFRAKCRLDAARRRLVKPDVVRSYARRYYRDHRNRLLSYSYNYRARRLNAAISDFTDAQWQFMKDLYAYRCVYCGRQFERLTQDHVIPLTKCGNHHSGNIVPCCRYCNSHKRNRSFPPFVVPILHVLDVERLDMVRVKGA